LWFDTACFPVPPVDISATAVPVISGPVNNCYRRGEVLLFLRERQPDRSSGRLFNAWNHAQFDPPNGNAGAGPNFGRISSSGPSRLIQVAAKVYW
jgi:hypothetical protein